MTIVLADTCTGDQICNAVGSAEGVCVTPKPAGLGCIPATAGASPTTGGKPSIYKAFWSFQQAFTAVCHLQILTAFFCCRDVSQCSSVVKVGCSIPIVCGGHSLPHWRHLPSGTCRANVLTCPYCRRCRKRNYSKSSRLNA